MLGSLCVTAICPTMSCGAPAQSQPEPVQAQPETKPAPPTPIAEKKAELGDDETWNPAWDKMIEEALPADFLSPKRSRAVKGLCPRFKTMSVADKRAFWAYFFQALAGAEAGLKPTANVRHNDPEVAVIDTVTKRTVRQEGLLQLTYMDADRYGCDFDWQADKSLPEHDPAKTILQPKNNLLCGIRILDNQMVSLHKPVLTDKSYWVTLRPGTYSYLLFMKQMKNVPRSCGPTPIRRGWFWRHKTPPILEAEDQGAAPSGPAPQTDAEAPASRSGQASATRQPPAAKSSGQASRPASAGQAAATVPPASAGSTAAAGSSATSGGGAAGSPAAKSH